MTKQSKVIWITGASSGFGKECAKALLEQGHIVYASARHIENMQDLANLGANIIHVDVCDDVTIQQAVQHILAEQGRIDGLLANAGYGAYGVIESIPIEEVQHQFDVNVFGVARCINAVLPIMRQARHGHIVITESLASHASILGIGWYSATKHALRGMHTALRQEVQGFGIHISSIEPGSVKTGFGQVAHQQMTNRPVDKDYQSMTQVFADYLNRPSRPSKTGMQNTVNAMVHALTSDHPKTSYRTTKDAKWIPRLLKILPETWFDKIVLQKIKKQSNQKDK